MGKSKIRGFADIQPNAADEAIRPDGLLEQGRVLVEDVRVLPGHAELDDDIVSSIAESFPLTGGGPLNPIIVRRVRERQDGKKKVTQAVLVAGAQRLEAARLKGLKFINCVYIDGDEKEARLAQIAEDIFRKELTVLQRAENLAEWLSLAIANLSGQVVLEGKGRSFKGIVRAARALPAVGRSVDARRKILERALSIARLPPEVKEAVKEAGLDDNQNALLKITQAKGLKAQHSRVENLRWWSEDSKPQPDKASKASATSRDWVRGGASSVMQNPSLKSGVDDAPGDDKSEAGHKPISFPEKRTTTFGELEELWDREGRELWAFAPFSERVQFIEKLRRAKCKAQVDVVAFVNDLFRGREKVEKRALYALAKSKGLSKKSVRETLNVRGYQAQRKGQKSAAVWYFRNINRDWKEEIRSISDEELGAASVAHPESQKVKPPKGFKDDRKARHDFYSTI